MTGILVGSSSTQPHHVLRGFVACSSADARVDAGELEVDESEDFWADHDSDPDTEFNRDEFPEGFKWDCCEQKGDSEEPGCKRGPHQAEDQYDAKRRQVGT